MTEARAEARAIAGLLRGAFAPAETPAEGVVVAIERDSNQVARAATVRLTDGSQDARVPLLGQDVRTGQAVRVARSVNQPTSPDWRLVGVIDSATPFPGLDADLTIPPPTWATTALSSAVRPAHAGGQEATVAVYLRETPQKFAPRATEIRWRVGVETIWTSVSIEDQALVDADLAVTLPASFPLSIVVNVQARTHTLGRAYSDWTELRTITTATDPTAPTAPASFTVELNLNLTALIKLPSPSSPLTFDHWQISVAESPAGLNAHNPLAGAGAPPVVERGQQHAYVVPSPRSAYLRIREVNRSGVASAWYPAASWAGPYAIVRNDAIIDTTPPDMPTVASAVATQEMVQGVVGVTIAVTLAAHTLPADFSHYNYRFYDGTSFDYRQSATGLLRYLNARQGVTYQVSVSAHDVNSNASAFSPAVAVTTPSLLVPTPTPTVTAKAIHRGVVVSWTAVPDTVEAGRIIAYQVERTVYSTAGVPGPWELVTETASLNWVDASNLIARRRYDYRVRAVNANRSVGPWSTSATAFTEQHVTLGRPLDFVTYYFYGTIATTAVNVDLVIPILDLSVDIPITAQALIVRYSHGNAAVTNLYLHGGGPNAPEFGLYTFGPGTISGIVPIDRSFGSKRIYLRSQGSTVSGILVVLGYVD